MTVWIFLAISAAVAWLLLRPLLSGEVVSMAREREERQRLRDLLSTKEATYSALRDIEFDHMMHKLSDADFQSLRSQYRAQAIRLLKEIDKLRPAATCVKDPQAAAGSRQG
ncbi:MAG: hypothetical protein O7F16_01030 [Acidobacteria bacterium]|nr:hypothetical protein [Acidobacteriota bacterium]